MTKGMRRPTTRRTTSKPVKSKTLKTKSAKPKAMPKRAAAAKAPAKKAVIVTARSSSKTKPTKKLAKPTSKAAAPKAKVTKKAPARKSATTSRVAATPARVKKTHAPVRAVRALKPVAPPPPRQPTVDETAALHAFDRAHREFTRGRFQEARNQFRVLLERYAQVSEVAARARTYLAISEARLRTDSMLPRDADSLYDRGVIELNRGEYVAAQEMFERALKREPEAAHIHYGLAATRARLGAIDLALQSLQRALDLQPNLRVRAQHDHDLTPLRNDPDFDKLVFTSRL
ncbi:MAG TPA: tetratricopeptide repeat protein [Pyrinomonadaceae bacterium]|nr:tetratricopeptide repeat protein [Pyrinomonadaceae bacterium]